MDVHPIKNAMYRYWSLLIHSHLVTATVWWFFTFSHPLHPRSSGPKVHIKATETKRTTSAGRWCQKLVVLCCFPPMIPNICIRITRISLNIAVDKHIERGMKLTDGSLAVRLSPCSVRPDTTGDLMKGTTDFYLPPVRPDVGHFKVQKIVWPMKTATVCHHSDSYCLYILKWKSSYFLKNKK